MKKQKRVVMKMVFRVYFSLLGLEQLLLMGHHHIHEDNRRINEAGTGEGICLA